MPELSNPKHERFAQEYVVDFNASAAGARIGYTPEHGRRLLQDVAIKARIEELRDALSLRTGITAERIALEYARLAFADVRDFASIAVHEGEDGPETVLRVKTFDELPRDITASIREISERVDNKGRTLTIKQYDKQRALDVLRDRYWTNDEADDEFVTSIAANRERTDVPDMSEDSAAPDDALNGDSNSTHNTQDGADPPADPPTKWAR